MRLDEEIKETTKTECFVGMFVQSAAIIAPALKIVFTTWLKFIKPCEAVRNFV